MARLEIFNEKRRHSYVETSPTSLFISQLSENGNVINNTLINTISQDYGRRMSMPVLSMGMFPLADSSSDAQSIADEPFSQNFLPVMQSSEESLISTSFPSMEPFASNLTASSSSESLNGLPLSDSLNALMTSYNAFMFPQQYNEFGQQQIQDPVTNGGHTLDVFSVPGTPSMLPSAPQQPSPVSEVNEFAPNPQEDLKQKLQTFIDPDFVKKNSRFKAKDNDLKLLMTVFEKNPFPSVALRKKLSEKLGMDQRQVQFWFQNRRATLKMNGIHVIKPKLNGGLSFTGNKPPLVPLQAEGGYFFVEKSQ